MTPNGEVGGSVRRFVVQASVHPPSSARLDRRGLVERKLCVDRRDSIRNVRDLHQRGYWVEVLDRDTGELVAGPFDPDQPSPSFVM